MLSLSAEGQREAAAAAAAGYIININFLSAEWALTPQRASSPKAKSQRGQLDLTSGEQPDPFHTGSLQ